MSRAICPRCKASYYTWSVLDNHQNRNLFAVLDMENNSDNWDDAMLVCAFDHDKAADIAAERMDDEAGDGPKERLLHVKQVEDQKGNAIAGAEVKQFDITFDYSVDYHSHERRAK